MRRCRERRERKRAAKKREAELRDAEQKLRDLARERKKHGGWPSSFPEPRERET